MKKEICKECGKPFDPSYAKSPLVVPNLKEPLKFGADYIPEICADCMSQGWTENPEEVRKSILEDNELGKRVYHKLD